MPEDRPAIIPSEGSERTSLFNPEKLQVFLGDSWEYTPTETLDYFKLRSEKTDNYLGLMYSKDTKGIFKLYLKSKKEDLLYGKTGIHMTNIQSVDFLPPGPGNKNGRSLRINAEGTEFVFYPDILQGLFKDNQGNSCYFNFGLEIREPSVG